MHVGSVMVFRPGEGGLDVARLLRHVEARIALVPRYRQRVRFVPGRIANPVWVDDERFDISYHVRRSALPRPGSQEQLEELVARVQARRLDRSRPLWELDRRRGPAGRRVRRDHQGAPGAGGRRPRGGPRPGRAGRRPGRPRAAAAHLAPAPASRARPSSSPPPSPTPCGVRSRARRHRPRRLGDLLTAGGRAAEALGGLAVAARARPDPGPQPAERRHRRPPAVRHARDGPGGLPPDPRPPPRRAPRRGRRAGTTVNDVVLATLAVRCGVAAGPRGWGWARAAIVRALVPMSVKAEDPSDAGAIGSRVASLLVDLPTGEPSPLMRLHQVAYPDPRHREAGQALSAPRSPGSPGSRRRHCTRSARGSPPACPAGCSIWS